jgi:hypothetical protein
MAAKKRPAAAAPETTTTFTLKFTTDERELVQHLVEARAKELREAAGQAIDVTIASYLRWLIERDAQARGLRKPPSK